MENDKRLIDSSLFRFEHTLLWFGNWTQRQDQWLGDVGCSKSYLIAQSGNQMCHYYSWWGKSQRV